MSTWRAYDEGAAAFAQRYESIDFDTVHEAWRRHLPASPGTALDVGAGSGRDAAALARRGWSVVAAEPAEGMLAEARRRHRGLDIEWLGDHLPHLTEVGRLCRRFDLVLANAVLMHLPVQVTAASVRRLAELTAPGGRLVVSVRVGDLDLDRGMRPVDEAELRAHAAPVATVLEVLDSADRHDRQGIRWCTAVLSPR